MKVETCCGKEPEFTFQELKELKQIYIYCANGKKCPIKDLGSAQRVIRGDDLPISLLTEAIDDWNKQKDINKC